MSTTAELTEEKVLEVLRTIRFPGLSRDIVSFGFVKELAIGGGNVSFRLEIITESPRAAEEIRREATEKLRSLPGVNAVTVRLDVQPPGPAPPRGAAGVPPPAGEHPAGGPLQGRGRVGQGGGRQVHGRGEPRARARARRAQGGPDGFRHLRPVAADDDGNRRETLHQRGEPDRADRPLRREGHVPRLPDGRGPAGHLARADGHEGRRAVPAGRGLGRSSISCSSICRPGPATRS